MTKDILPLLVDYAKTISTRQIDADDKRKVKHLITMIGHGASLQSVLDFVHNNLIAAQNQPRQVVKTKLEIWGTIAKIFRDNLKKEK